MGMLAIETGWTVTEVGRQPWTVYNILRTADAVTPMTGLVVPFVTFTILYVILSIAVVVLLKRMVFADPMALDGSGIGGDIAEIPEEAGHVHA